jgi:hypothetical protein
MVEHRALRKPRSRPKVLKSREAAFCPLKKVNGYTNGSICQREKYQMDLLVFEQKKIQLSFPLSPFP